MSSKHYLLQFFEYKHLPQHLQEVSKPFYEMAHNQLAKLPVNPESTTAFRKLLECKDCAVRSLIFEAGGD